MWKIERRRQGEEEKRSALRDPLSGEVLPTLPHSHTPTLLLLLLLAGCHQAMQEGSRLKPLEAASIFTDNRSSRTFVPGTVARDDVVETAPLPPDTLPMPLTRALLDRGRERFNIYCRPCHGAGGDGKGMIVRRGFSPPPSYHTDRLRNAPLSHFYDVITNGYGAMYPYGDRVKSDDRWAVAAYIRALQLSQHAPAAALPAGDRTQLEGAP
jgi:mono/diheme cytochrome c family protein